MWEELAKTGKGEREWDNSGKAMETVPPIDGHFSPAEDL